MTEASSTGDVIQAAGGLLWRESPRGRQVAVVHRPKHDDWSLPKGKLKEGESWQEAAEREVTEETGCIGRLDSPAGSIAYTANGRPKVVLFWHMDLAEAGELQPTDEVDRVAWWTPAQAAARLDHPRERDLVRRADGLHGLTPPSWFRSWVGRWLGGSERLAADLVSYRLEIEQLLEKCRDQGPPCERWAGDIEQLLDKASESLKAYDTETAWRCLHAAQRVELLCLAETSPDRLRAEAERILAEGRTKLTGWRKECVVALLCDGDALKGDKALSVDEVRAAGHILHEHYGNMYNKIRTFMRQVGVAAAGLIALGLALVLYVILGPPLVGEGASAEGPHAVIRVILFGMMGALLSTVLPGVRPKVPDQLSALLGALFRPIIGGVSALVIYVFLMSGILAFGDAMSPALVLAVAFVSGFSDRLVLRAVEAVGGSKKET